MPGIYDGRQPAFNAEAKQAFFSGQEHATYGLIALAGLSLYTFVVPGEWLWLVVALMFGIVVGLVVDLYVNRYLH